MKLVLCGEAYGQRENNMKHALVGASGRELTVEMGKAELAPFMQLKCRKCHNFVDFTGNFHCSNCNEYLAPIEFDLIRHWKRMKDEYQIAITNVFNEQPPNNGLEYFFGPDRETDMPSWKPNKKATGSHLKKEFFHHITRLRNEITALEPNLIMLMGNSAIWGIMEHAPRITDMRGYVDWSERLNVKVIPTYHPAHVLRNPIFKTTCIADYRKAKIESQFKEIIRPERWITVIDPTPAGIKEGYDWFCKPATAYANDIETWRNMISIIGFARAKDDALVIPFRNEEDKGNPNYWPTAELEFEAWKLAIFGLQTPQPKIFQNGVFDMSHYMQMGIQVRNPQHDTMLWHHSFLPELPKSLGYLGSLYCNDIAWKRMRRKETLKRDE